MLVLFGELSVLELSAVNILKCSLATKQQKFFQIWKMLRNIKIKVAYEDFTQGYTNLGDEMCPILKTVQTCQFHSFCWFSSNIMSIRVRTH